MPVEIEHVGLNAAGLAELVDVGLVKMVGQGRAQMHRTLRAEVRKRLAETALDGPVLAQLLRRAESVRYFETAATVAESEQAASIIRDAGLPEETAGECLAVLGSFQARKDTKAAAKWYEMALKLLPPPDDDELSAIQAQLICACLQGVTRAVLRSRIASVSEKRLARERLVAVPGMAAKFPDDPAVQIAASRADAMDGLLRRQIAETVVDPDEQLSALKEALEQLRRSAATRRMWVLEDSPDIDRSLFNISGTLVLVAKAVNDQREVRPLLDEAERAYMEIGRIRARRYRTENLEEVITCVNGRGIVSFYRAILQPELSASERMAAIKMARDHAYRAMMVREGLASRDGLSEDSMKSAKILAKTVVLQHHMAARMNHVKRDAMPDLLKETLVEHERLVVTEVKSW